MSNLEDYVELLVKEALGKEPLGEVVRLLIETWEWERDYA